MAAQRRKNRTGQQKISRGSQAIVVFWLVFITIIVSVFIANTETIKNNFNMFKSRLTSSPGAEEIPSTKDETSGEPAVQEPPPAAREPVSTEPETRPQTPAPVSPAPSTARQPEPQPPQPAQTRDRNIYFTQIDRDGQILRSRVSRKIPVSDSPMQDVLNAMLLGPSAEELNRGIINLIPQNTRILSAAVRGDTAYINFSEDFLFNTFGVEGYVAQLRQIVWTVTEFSNVKDVQILIEGKRLDYLGEGIWIGSPISRQSF